MPKYDIRCASEGSQELWWGSERLIQIISKSMSNSIHICSPQKRLHLAFADTTRQKQLNQMTSQCE